MNILIYLSIKLSRHFKVKIEVLLANKMNIFEVKKWELPQSDFRWRLQLFKTIHLNLLLQMKWKNHLGEWHRLRVVTESVDRVEKKEMFYIVESRATYWYGNCLTTKRWTFCGNVSILTSSEAVCSLGVMEVNTDTSIFLTQTSWLRSCRLSDVAVVAARGRHGGPGDQVQEDRLHHAATAGRTGDLRTQLQGESTGDCHGSILDTG